MCESEGVSSTDTHSLDYTFHLIDGVWQLVKPDAPPPPPTPRRHPTTEIQDEARREMAKSALLDLWIALNLESHGANISLPSDPPRLHYPAYRYFGEMILGDDCPEGEMLT